MKTLFHRLRFALRSSRNVCPDVDAAAPLTQLLEDAVPEPDLFARIEARLDGRSRRRINPHGGGPVAAVFFAGLVLGAAAMFALQDKQEIVARPTADASWVPLGSVTLRGAGLRGFVRAKCEGHTHFLITMHGHAPTDDDDEAMPLMGADEKILMECIF
ncbi:MAG: hypothetical protein AAGK77_07465 [Pseudomonadota bacterium]